MNARTTADTLSEAGHSAYGRGCIKKCEGIPFKAPALASVKEKGNVPDVQHNFVLFGRFWQDTYKRRQSDLDLESGTCKALQQK